MGAIIKQLDGAIVSPKDDAVLYKTFNSEDGVIRGCEITHLGSNQIKVGEGYVYLCGRMVEIEEETVLSPFAGKSAAGELVLRIDLLSDTPAKLVARTPRTALMKEDINAGGAVYEFLMATYTVSDIGITGLKIEYGYKKAGQLGGHIFAPTCTQAQYNAMPSHPDGTIYFIKEG